MKRLLLLIALVLGSAVAWADGWYGTSPQTSSEKETPVFLQVKVNGAVMNTGVEVAAYVEGECRAIVTSPMDVDGNYFYRLRVRGNADDVGKDISFKVFYNKLVYTFPAKTHAFDEETVPASNPIILNVDAVMGISLTNPINIVAAIPATRDLTQDITILYDEANRKNESALESVFTYTWTPAAVILSVAGNTLTASAVTPPDGIALDLTVKGPNYGNNAGPKQYSFTTSTQVIVTEPVVEVSKITVSPATLTLEVGENYLTKMNELCTVTVEPAEASDKSWSTSIDPTSTATASTAGIITAPGTLKVIVTSNSNPEVKATLTITVPTPVSFKYPAELMLSKLHATPMAFTEFVGDNFDKSLITVTFSNASNDQPCATAVMADDTGLNWNVTGLYVGNSYTYQVKYNGTPMKTTTDGTAGVVRIPAEVALNNAGWDWISLYAFQSGKAPYTLKPAGDYLGWLNLNANNKVIDVRSQTALLYNDDIYGFIGDITELSPTGGMYKVKAKYEDANLCVIDLGADCDLVTSTTETYNTIQTGYTWISFPMETATTIGDTRLAETAQSGDMIIGKTSSALFNGTEWQPADFALLPGKGYIYYTTGGGGFRPNFNAPASGGVKRFAPKQPFNSHLSTFNSTPSPWKYDASPFADNMPVVAALEGVEDGDRFSIGAYVGSECRGEGRAVDGNLFIINVAGKAGELVRFRLYDKETEEFFDLDQALIYTAMHGSLRAPVRLSGSGVVDAVKGIHHSQFTIHNDGNAYNLAGQRISNAPLKKGVIIQNGRKVVK